MDRSRKNTGGGGRKFFATALFVMLLAVVSVATLSDNGSDLAADTPADKDYAFEQGDLAFKVTQNVSVSEDKTTGHSQVTVTGYASGYSGSADTLEIPDKLSNVTLDSEYTDWDFDVVSIADSAFQGNADLIYVYIPSSVTQIGANAFAGTAIEFITIPYVATAGSGAISVGTVVVYYSAAASATATSDATDLTITLTPTTGGTITGITVGISSGSSNLYNETDNTGVAVIDLTDLSGITSIYAALQYAALDVTYNLTNLTQIEPVTVAYGGTLSFTLTVASEGFSLPSSITVTVGGVATTNFTYNSTSGAVSVPNVNGDVVVTAVGVQITYTVTFNGGANLTANPTSPVNYGASATFTIGANAGYGLPATITVTVGGTALTTSQYTYNSSNGAVSIPGVTGNVVVTASAATLYTLTLADNVSNGTVYYTVAGGSEEQLTTTAVSVSEGVTVLFRAVADSDNLFSYWTGGVGGNTNPAYVTISGDMTVGAAFIASGSALTVTPGEIENGSLQWALNDSNSWYDLTGALTVAPGTVLQIKAVAASGYSFSQWTGDLGGTSNPYTLTVDKNIEVSAEFEESSLSLTLIIAIIAIIAVIAVAAVLLLKRKKKHHEPKTEC